MTNPEHGIDIPKVIFRDGEPVPPSNSSSFSNPQKVWYDLEHAQRWAAFRILAIGTDLQYSEALHTPKNEIYEADSLRESGKKYTDKRGLNTLNSMFSIEKKSQVVSEFEGKKVIDIGSGAGVLANDLRKKAHAEVTEVDFSEKAQEAAQPIFKNMGRRILADACNLSYIENGSFDASISMYSTTVHTDTIYRRLKSFTEALRVTKTGGRSYFVPFIGAMIMQHNTWHMLERAIAEGKIDPQDSMVIEESKSIQREVAMKYSLIGLTKKLIKLEYIDFRPCLLIVRKNTGIESDAVSAICDIRKPLSSEDANELINPFVQAFS